MIASETQRGKRKNSCKHVYEFTTPCVHVYLTSAACEPIQMNLFHEKARIYVVIIRILLLHIF